MGQIVKFLFPFFDDARQVSVLRYVFTLVNGLQGVFICLSFVFNRRVAKLSRACCRGDRPPLTSSTSARSSASSSSSSYRNTTMSIVSRGTETSFTSAVSAVKT